ncbi:MAG TPA: uroporphyrinogen-III C-methyltransferase [Candidatus Dormibacteraeota bacterium]|nr:uroporphyrinogen-III C-methyltransferase [Candidatus Dormibacteraeota bacterium]
MTKPLGEPRRSPSPSRAIHASESGVIHTAGKVYLVGAGPGDPDLLTLKALRVLQAADVVLHDDLVAPKILALAPSSSTVHNVGKRCGRKTMSQDEIHTRMIDAARGGNTVVRLKGGDPTIFGRVGEELQALQASGVECEMIPGVTSAFAAAAAAQIPLTDRRWASRIVFLTGHRCGTGPDNSRLEGITSNSTVVIYMPGERIGQIAEQLAASGMGAATPCLVVSAASTSRQQMYRLRLDELPNAPRWPAPAVLIVGEVVQQSTVASRKPNQQNQRPEFATTQNRTIQNQLPRFAMIQNELPEFAARPYKTTQTKPPKPAPGQHSVQRVVAIWRRLMWNFAEAWYG